MIRKLIFPLCALSLISCGSGGHQTLADLRYEKKQEKPIEFEKMDYQQVREEYQELLTLFKDDELKEQIERRIAEVFMLEGGEKQLEETKVKSYYAEAIRSYQEILEKYPNSPDNADVLYQLARAYEMDGHIEKELEMLEQLTSRHPNYKNNSEAHFRMGEIYYSDQRYAKAQTEYKLVALSQDPKLLKYAYYMLGWTQYKQSNFEPSVEAFAKVLNLLMQQHDEVSKVTKTDQPLVQDAIASMSLALARNGGAEVIERTQSLLGKPYLWLIYDSLGEYYLKKERYEDSAETFRQYVQRYNFSAKAPDLHSKLISTYINGGFPLQALKEKEVYVGFYGLASEYAKSNGGINDTVKGQLKIYYDELASHYHNQAQSLEKQYAKLAKNKPSKKNDKKLKTAQANMYFAFEKAASFYHQFVNTFPEDKKVPEFTFLQAEAFYSAKKYTQAIKLFERTAYDLAQFEDKQYQSKAGYAAIISYQNLIKELTSDKQDTSSWQAQAVDSMLKFAQVFHQDKRSPAVLTNAAEYLFGLEEYQRALQVSQNLLKAHPDLAQKLKKTAFGIAAHSHFKLGQLEQAEANYFNQRQLTKKSSQEYKDITERMATTMFKRSEELIVAGNKQLAIDKLLKIKTVTPGSKIKVSAHYNAATLLLETEQWSQAIKELTELKSTQPKHKLAPQFARKLAFAYEKNKSFKAAADAYLKLSKQDKDAKTRQDSLFIAAGLYEKNKNYATAIDLFKRYARTYEQPFEVRMEARFRLAELYQKTSQESKKLFWLRRIIEGDKKAGEQRNDRSKWLAAWANTEYGDYFAKEFKKARLTSNLEKSLPRKNKALTDSIKRYEMAADYGILEYITMSSVKMANLYLDFGYELRNVKLPKGLTQEERAMYKQVLEEQAQPFDSLAQELHQGNIERAWQGEYNQWIQASFTAMETLSPARFDKKEINVSYGDEIR